MNDFASTIRITENGEMEVTEVIKVTFSESKHGIIRAIPLKYQLGGKTKSLNIDNVLVSNDEFQTYKEDGRVYIKIGSPSRTVIGEKEYRISYVAQNAILNFGEHQEFYYNVTGNETAAPIEHVSYTVEFPRYFATAADGVAVYTGTKGSKLTNATIKQSSTQFSGETTKRLNPYEGVTLAIKLPKDYIQMPVDLTVMEKQNWYSLILPIGFFYFLLSFRIRLVGEHAVSDEEVDIEMYPPKGITSAHAGSFIDQVANVRDVVSLIPYWASEGLITLAGSGDDITIQKIENIPAEYPVYEKKFFNALFKSGPTTTLKDLKEKLYADLYIAQSQLNTEVKSQGYYSESYLYWFKSWRIWIGMLIAIVIGFLSIFYLEWIFTGIFFFLLAVGMMVLAVLPRAISPHGREIIKRLKGLRKFIQDPPSEKLDHLLSEDPKYFEKMLPYAVAFGLDKQWMAAFETRMEYAPMWYIHPMFMMGHAPFHSFSTGFEVQEVTSAFSSVPASSGGGGGGFSGGSGGGVGGGGVSSW